MSVVWFGASSYQNTTLELKVWNATMILRNLTTSLLALVTAVSLGLVDVTGVYGSALTTTVGPNEKLCFYADVDKEGEKVGVSFSRYLCTTWVRVMILMQTFIK